MREALTNLIIEYIMLIKTSNATKFLFCCVRWGDGHRITIFVLYEYLSPLNGYPKIWRCFYAALF